MVDSAADVGKPSAGAIESLFCRTTRTHNDVVIPSVKAENRAVAPPSSMGMLGLCGGGTLLGSSVLGIRSLWLALSRSDGRA